MDSELIIFYSNSSKEDIANVAVLAEFMGLKPVCVDIGKNIKSINSALNASDRSRCAVISAEALALRIKKNTKEERNDFLFNNFDHVLVYGFVTDSDQNELISWLTLKSISGVSGFDKNDYKYEISCDNYNVTKEFTGVSFGPIDNETDFKFEISNKSNQLQTLISIDKKPFFVQFRRGNCNLFLLGCREIININENINRDFSFRKCFSQLIPAVMFMKYVFKDRCWHTNNIYANLNIDDPWLNKEKYGFLSYKKLLGLTKQHGFAASVAFIPYNWKKTSKKTAELFNKNTSCLSVCVHGCDHTNDEFGINDCNLLNRRIESATERMDVQERLTGLSYDKVMVFPQGRFSKESMKMLKTNNYWAAMNIGYVATNSKVESLRIADVIDIAIMNYYEFPLFPRMRLTDIFDYIFYLFFRKPLVLAIHHDYLKNDGYEKLIAFINKINSISHNIKWESSGNLVRKTYLQKNNLDGSVSCKIFSSSVLIKNEFDSEKIFRIIKKESKQIPIKMITLNGKTIPYILANDFLSFDVIISGNDTANIQITYEKIAVPEAKITTVLTSQAKIFLVRKASEFRDNYLSRSDLIMKLFEKLRKFKRRVR